jgi:hypothetical protein
MVRERGERALELGEQRDVAAERESSQLIWRAAKAMSMDT